MNDINVLRTYSLEQVNNLYKNGAISEKLTLEYIKLWNETPNEMLDLEIKNAEHDLIMFISLDFMKNVKIKGELI